MKKAIIIEMEFKKKKFFFFFFFFLCKNIEKTSSASFESFWPSFWGSGDWLVLLELKLLLDDPGLWLRGVEFEFEFEFALKFEAMLEEEVLFEPPGGRGAGRLSLVDFPFLISEEKSCGGSSITSSSSSIVSSASFSHSSC